MSKTTLTLAYLNEDDRAYGLAGMAISLAALDAIDRVAAISLDADGPMVSFANEFYFSGSPSVSPKSTWHNLVHNFYITSAMAVSNLMARSLVRLGEEVPNDLLEAVHNAMLNEGMETCSLEDDEVDNLFTKTTIGMRRIFANRRLHPAIDTFARTLSRRRNLTGTEIYDELRELRLI
ncbi:MAG: hypothetical protein HDS12_05725 [Bacteroides sp.]|nr:hypothetical protein [Bacteroidales bacterium]MBD5204860.1 hypothetical protein [Bacteroidales bacterium]MBD5223088.1 hypothetical protein [Bacteroidales bacterium]MBD5305768.1 hypothetical protein [Bacteroides sp.]